MDQLLKKLSEAPSISGYEENVGKLIKAELSGKVDELREDSFGNIITRKGRGKIRVMLAAHMDEVGLMVKHIDDDGFVKFTRIGGLDNQVILCQRVQIHTRKGVLSGVLGAKPVHMLKEEEAKMAIKSESMFIDLGFKDKKAVEAAGVRIGDWISFDRETIKCGTRITGKAFDNRIGCAVLVELMKKIKPNCEVYGVFTTQEEVGLKGARVSAFGIDPHFALAIDTDLVGDTPGITPDECNAGLGKGPVITISDGGRGDSSGSGLMTSRKVIDWLEDSAKKAKINYQMLVSSGGTTDATIIALNRSGVPTGTLGIPTRYLHTPVQVLDIEDAKDMVKLVESALNNLPKL